MRSWTCVLILLLLTAAVSSCRIGSDPAKSPAATSPFGVNMGIRLHSASTSQPIEAELLAIKESGYLVDDGTSIMLVPFGSAAEARLNDVPGIRAIKGDPPREDLLERARMHARYPFGLTEAQLASLLEDRGQEALIVR